VTITADDLDRWEALGKMSTRGPWSAMGATARRIEGPFGHLVTMCEYLDDAAFIAAARTAVPDLCKEVRQLRVQRSAYRSEADALRVEASELRACLKDAVGKIEVMRVNPVAAIRTTPMTHRDQKVLENVARAMRLGGMADVTREEMVEIGVAMIRGSVP
jgi:hypothetical protein